MLSRSTWKYLKNIRSYKYQNDEKGQRVLIEKMSELSVLLSIYFTTAVAFNQLMRHDNLCCNKIRILNMIDHL